MWRSIGQFYENKTFSSTYQGQSEVVHIVLLPIGAVHGWSVVTETEKSGSKWCSGLIDTHGKVGLGEGCALPWSLHKKMNLNNFFYYAGLCGLLRL